MLLQVILVVVLSLLGRLGVEGRRRKELPIDRELPGGEAGFTQQRAKASGEQSKRCKRRRKVYETHAGEKYMNTQEKSICRRRRESKV